MTDEAKARALLGKREDMIKVPQAATVHMNEDGFPVLTLSEGEGTESYSFLFTRKMSQSVAEGLLQAISTGIEPTTAH